MTARRVVIVGASLAGASVAVRLRELGFDGSVTLIGDEPHLPYERPALSKNYLTGSVRSNDLLVHRAGTYSELAVELRLGWTVTSLDAERRVVRTWDGLDVPYDVLVVATGARNARPRLPGIHLSGVHQLRTVDEADSLGESAATATNAVVVGMGFIGCEVAATLRGLGLSVTMVDRAAGPLLAQLGPQISTTVCQWHEDHGVRVLPCVDVQSLAGDRAVEAVQLGDGTHLDADLVVVGVGVRPATAWLENAPVHLVQGAVGVDVAGRTNLEGVYAAGDVTALCDPSTGGHRRVEHYRAAIDEADRVARAIVGDDPPRWVPSWFWSDQYEHTLHYAGDRSADDEVHAREDGVTMWLREGVLAAVAAVDAGRAFRQALKLLGTDVTDDIKGALPLRVVAG